MIYDSWNIRCDSSPSPLTCWKIKSLKPWRYYHFTNVYHKWQSYDVWLLRYGAQQTDKNHDHMLHCSWETTCDRCNFHFSFWAIFCPFTPPTLSNDPKNQNFEKMKKKTTGDIIILYMCNENYYHMMYSSWDMVYNSFKLEMNITESHFFKELTMNRKLKWFFLSFWVTFEFFVFSVVTELLTAHKGQCFIF